MKRSKTMFLSQGAKNAIFIGTICSVLYLAAYIARNVLSAVTPQMVELGYDEKYIGKISSFFFIAYAIGQLINGAVGDRINAKWMICIGLFGSGITNFVFSKTTLYPLVAMLVYGLTGFFLSMIYGPMTKIVSENTELIHATRCSLGYTFASFFGSPVAGILASFLVWESAFIASSMLLVFIATVSFIAFTVLERRGTVQYHKYKSEKEGLQNVKILFKHHIVKFSLISILTGIVRTSVVFWLPTYIAQHLKFIPKYATSIFTVATLVISFSAFISVFIYEVLKRNMNKTLLLMFTCSTVFFALTYLISLPILNVIFIVLAIMSSNGATNMLWSIYCPSLRNTGMVSSVTGYLDFLSYMAAAVANLIFANAVSDIGWKNLILVWTGLMAFGVIIALPYQSRKNTTFNFAKTKN